MYDFLMYVGSIHGLFGVGVRKGEKKEKNKIPDGVSKHGRWSVQVL